MRRMPTRPMTILLVSLAALWLLGCGGGANPTSPSTSTVAQGEDRATTQPTPESLDSPTALPSSTSDSGVLAMYRDHVDSVEPFVTLSPEGAEASNMLDQLGVDVAKGLPDTINASGDWARVEEDWTLAGAVGGIPFSVGEPDTSEFTQDGARAYAFPRVSSTGTLYVVSGTPGPETTGLFEAPTVENAELVQLNPATGETRTIYRWRRHARIRPLQ
jgi:hypothetical protein